MITAVSIFSCTNDYDPGLIENLGMKEQPLRIITKVLTTKSPNFMQEFTRGSVIGLHVVSESTGNIYDSNPDYKNVLAAEMLGGKSGIGFLITRGMDSGDYALCLLSMVCIGLVGALLAIITQLLERMVCPWTARKSN